jgi:hypothetical protein
VGDNLQDQQFRSTLSFNTASIPDGAVITKVTFKVKRYTIVGINPCTTYGNLLMDVRRGSFSGNPALQRTDFHAYSNAGAAVPCAASNGWYTKVWPSGLVNYINKTGLTQLRLRFSRDDNDDLSADYLNFYSGDYGTTSYRPQLIIEYYVP